MRMGSVFAHRITVGEFLQDMFGENGRWRTSGYQDVPSGNLT